MLDTEIKEIINLIETKHKIKLNNNDINKLYKLIDRYYIIDEKTKENIINIYDLYIIGHYNLLFI